MQPRISTYITAIAVIAVIAALAVPLRLVQAQQKNQQPSKYYVFNLGAPLGGVPEAVGINNLGWISGGANLVGNATVHAEAWVGVPFDLGTLGGPNSNVSWPNHSTHGEIVGIAETADINPLREAWSCSAFFFGPDGYVCRGFAWQDGVMSELPTLGGYNGYAAGVNNKGQVVGWAENTVHDPTCNNAPPANQVLQFKAVIWGPKLNQLTQLPPLAPDPDSAATAINDKSQVVGISGLCSNAVGGASAEHALLWENGMPTDLGNIGGKAWNTPVAINNQGEIAGFANTSGDENAALSPTAFIWTKAAGMQAIPPVGTDTNDIAFDLNNKGQVVGLSIGAGGDRAFLYQKGQMSDLNGLVVQPTSLYLNIAQGINDAGEISGTATDTSTGLAVGFLAVPVFDGSGSASASRVQAGPNSRQAIPAESVRRRLQQLPGLSGLLLRAMGSK
jgi:probable HAF family extracellular repeat protein